MEFVRYTYFDGAAQCVDRAWKLSQRRIASPIEYPAVKRGDFVRYQGLTGRELCDSFLLRLLHHRGVADDVANHDRRNSTLHGKASLRRRSARSCHFILSFSGVTGKLEALAGVDRSDVPPGAGRLVGSYRSPFGGRPRQVECVSASCFEAIVFWLARTPIFPEQTLATARGLASGLASRRNWSKQLSGTYTNRNPSANGRVMLAMPRHFRPAIIRHAVWLYVRFRRLDFISRGTLRLLRGEVFRTVTLRRCSSHDAADENQGARSAHRCAS